MDFKDFLVGATAPWWSTILGGVVGGLIAYFSTKASDERKFEAETERLAVERDRDGAAEWRNSVMTEAVAFYRLSEASRIALIQAFGEVEEAKSGAARETIAKAHRVTVSENYLELSARKFTFGVLGADDLREIAQATSDKTLQGPSALRENDRSHAVDSLNDEITQHQFEFRQAVRELLGFDEQLPLQIPPPSESDDDGPPLWNYGGK